MNRFIRINFFVATFGEKSLVNLVNYVAHNLDLFDELSVGYVVYSLDSGLVGCVTCFPPLVRELRSKKPGIQLKTSMRPLTFLEPIFLHN